VFIDDENEDRKDELILTLGIAYEMSQGEESFWFPYLRVLPIVPGLTRNEIKATKDSNLIDGIEES
jgi:hypothetical protein